MAAPFHVGVFTPQGWKTELRSIPDPQDQWRRVVDTAVLAEELGYDSVWVYDHVHNVPVPSNESIFECWTTMAALSQVTRRIRLGQMVGCAGYRNPGLLAKITSNIDVMSDGRLEWGIGGGWYEHEYHAYGYPFPAAKERLGILRDTVEIVTRMWRDAEATYEGAYLSVAGAQCDPKPLQDPRPPIWIGGGGEQVTLRIVARLADCSNFGGKPDEWTHKRDVLREHCAAVGRDYDEITKTWSPELFVRETEAEIVEAGSQSFWGEPFDSWRAGNLVGTPEQVLERIDEYRRLDLGGIVAWCSDLPEHETLRLFAEKVLPELR